MMNFRDRLERFAGNSASEPESGESEEAAEYKYFAIETARNVSCLDLRLPMGVRKALPYSYFTALSYDVEAGIEIFTSSKKVTITGRNLSKLFDYMVNYRVRYVQVNIGNDSNEDGLFVEEILIEELNN